MAAASGYALEDSPYASGHAGFKDWFILEYDKPGYTIECGLGENPLPISELTKSILRYVHCSPGWCWAVDLFRSWDIIISAVVYYYLQKRYRLMSENCNHDCSSCAENCESRKQSFLKSPCTRARPWAASSQWSAARAALARAWSPAFSPVRCSAAATGPPCWTQI